MKVGNIVFEEIETGKKMAKIGKKRPMTFLMK